MISLGITITDKKLNTLNVNNHVLDHRKYLQTYLPSLPLLFYSPHNTGSGNFKIFLQLDAGLLSWKPNWALVSFFFFF